MKILLAVDGSKHSLKAVRCLIEHAGWYCEMPAVELVNVHLPLPRIRGMSAVVGASQIRRYYDREGKAALSKARKLLGAAGGGDFPPPPGGPPGRALGQRAPAPPGRL